MKRSAFLWIVGCLIQFNLLSQKVLIPFALEDRVNTGNLKFWKYIPKHDGHDKLPLVVAFHGCTQSAESLNQLAGFTKLADRYKFALLFPEQRSANNPTLCFNWFNSQDVLPGNGELESVYQAINKIMQTHSLDTNRVFAYGLSAGAMMSVALMANYPNKIKAGAAFAGAPFDSNRDYFSGLGQMIYPVSKTDESLAKSVTDLHMNQIVQLPQLSIFHGLADQVVDPENSLLLCKQWLKAQGFKGEIQFSNAHSLENNRLIEQFFTKDSSNKLVILRRFEGLGHALPLEIGDDENQGGTTGKYGKDIGYFSTWFVLQDWGLISVID
jgi:poly(hydroxyalkanoate) depolymerase family esterase